MDAGRCPIGLLTNYDAYIVILRVSQSGIALSSPVLRKATSRNSLGPLKNEMSVLDLLLALLLYTARPGRLKGSVWSGLYVREIRREEPTHAKRKNEEGSGSRSGKRKGKIKQREEESEDGGGQSGRGLTERTDEDVGPSAGQEWHGTPVRISRKRPREFDKATTTMTTTETTFFPTSVDVSFSSEGEDQRIVTPTSFTFDHPNSQSLPSNSKRHPKHDPHLGPVLHLDYDPRHVPPVLSSLELEPLTMTSFYPVNRSDLWEIEPLERDLDIVLHRLIVVGNYFRTFSASMPPRTLDPERPSRSPSIIVKFAYLQDPEDSEELNSTSGSEAMQAVENEWKVLNGPLRDLQDRQIPKVYGMWRSGCGDWAMLVLEHIEGEQLEPGRELSRVEMLVLGLFHQYPTPFCLSRLNLTWAKQGTCDGDVRHVARTQGRPRRRTGPTCFSWERWEGQTHRFRSCEDGSDGLGS